MSLEVDRKSKHMIHVTVSKDTVGPPWAVSFIYGCPDKKRKGEVWDAIRNIAAIECDSWLVMGTLMILQMLRRRKGVITPNNIKLWPFRVC